MIDEQDPNPRRELVRRLVAAQEAERRQIALRLHDDLGQHVAAMQLVLEPLRRSDDAQERARLLEQLQTSLEVVGKSLHDLARALRPAGLDDLGPARALRHHLDDWSRSTGIAAEMHCRGWSERRFSCELESTLFRAVQEGLANAAKHARAARVSVVLERGADHVLAIVEDDGVGCDVESVFGAGGTPGFGLLEMRERVELGGGSLTLESTRNRGTTLLVRLPVTDEVPS